MLAEYQEDQRIKKELSSLGGRQKRTQKYGRAIQTFDDLLLAPPPPEDGLLLGGYSLEPVEEADLNMAHYKPKGFYGKNSPELMANKSRLDSSPQAKSDGRP